MSVILWRYTTYIRLFWIKLTLQRQRYTITEPLMVICYSRPWEWQKTLRQEDLKMAFYSILISTLQLCYSYQCLMETKILLKISRIISTQGSAAVNHYKTHLPSCRSRTGVRCWDSLKIKRHCWIVPYLSMWIKTYNTDGYFPAVKQHTPPGFLTQSQFYH